MTSVICLSNDEPQCIAGHDHKWGEIYKIKVTDYETPSDEKCRKCRHCAWVHLFKYSGVGKYRKHILLDDDMERPRTEPLCVKCKKKPSSYLTSKCLKCEGIVAKRHDLPTVIKRKDFIKFEMSRHGCDVWSLWKKYDMLTLDIFSWIRCDDRLRLEVMLKQSMMIPNEYDRAEFIKHISNLKNGFKNSMPRCRRIT